MSLEWLVKGEIGYFRGPATVGLIKGKTGWIFIDSGVDADVPKKIIKALLAHTGEKSLAISTVINTHAHADHTGGNAYLQRNYKTQVISSLGEKPYVENPYLEPHYLFSAEAPKTLHNKFFEAKPSTVNQWISFQTEGGQDLPVGSKILQIVDGISLEFISLSGHAKDMMGVLTGEEYFFCGDLLFPKIILEKHPLLFLHDNRKFLEALKWASEQSFKGIILTHGAYFNDHLPIVEETKQSIVNTRTVLLDLINRPMNECEIHSQMAQYYNLVEAFGDWHLNHGVIRSYLADGLESGLLQWENGLYMPLGTHA